MCSDQVIRNQDGWLHAGERIEVVRCKDDGDWCELQYILYCTW